jgi:NADPH:quinone reductase-like Zn-dependent oxidoreductase
MTSPIPKTTKAWTIEGHDGFDSLKFNKEAPLPEVSDYEVLVKFHAASLNYRDLIIPKGKFNCCSFRS